MLFMFTNRVEFNQKHPRLLRDTIGNILGPDSVPPPPHPVESIPVVHKLCYICPTRLKLKTAHFCQQCSKPVSCMYTVRAQILMGKKPPERCTCSFYT